MQLDDIQKSIHRLYQNGVDYPAYGDEDYSLRTGLINTFQREWAAYPGAEWEVLRDPVTGLYAGVVDLVQANDVTIVPDGEYLAFMTAARLFQEGHNNTGFTVNFDDAQSSLKAMLAANKLAIINRIKAADVLNGTTFADRLGGIGTFGC